MIPARKDIGAILVENGYDCPEVSNGAWRRMYASHRMYFQISLSIPGVPHVPEQLVSGH
jgi:hypothetical protein